MSPAAEGIFSFIVGAIVCSILLNLSPKGELGGMMKLLCGLYITVSLLYPLSRVEFEDLLSNWTFANYEDGMALSAMGEEFTRNQLAVCIKQEAEEYILDKAAAMDITLTADITVSDTDIPVPISVRLEGTVNAPDKWKLEKIIAEDLGISKENQLWREGNSAKE